MTKSQVKSFIPRNYVKTKEVIQFLVNFLFHKCEEALLVHALPIRELLFQIVLLLPPSRPWLYLSLLSRLNLFSTPFTQCELIS